MARPSVLILHAPGTNRDREAAWACELAGGVPEIVHIRQLRGGERRLRDYDLLLLPGGFTYGDALGAGTRLALDLWAFFQEELQAFVERGGRVLGICNGFQALVKLGLLPGRLSDAEGAPAWGPDTRRVTLAPNASGRFECRWVHLALDPNCRAPLSRKMEAPLFCPVAHGEGNFQVVDPGTLAALEAGGHVLFRYVDSVGQPARGRYPLNPNGSVADIAGLCNRQGNVVGLMPHPEDHVVPLQNPLRDGRGLGLRLFEWMLHP